MDVMYPFYLRGSKWDNNELRYSLRSIEKNFKDLERVFIVGDKPDWVQNVIHIPHDNSQRCKEHRIMDKIKTACLSDISQKFLFLNDDHFIIRQLSANDIRYWWCGMLEEVSEQRKKVSSYHNVVRHTLAVLKTMGKPTKYFDVHTPIVYDKDLFVKAMSSVTWGIPPTFVIKSLYCNYNNIHGTQIRNDVKLRSKQIPLDIGVISTDDIVYDSAKNFLKVNFSRKSMFEV